MASKKNKKVYSPNLNLRQVHTSPVKSRSRKIAIPFPFKITHTPSTHTHTHAHTSKISPRKCQILNPMKSHIVLCSRWLIWHIWISTVNILKPASMGEPYLLYKWERHCNQHTWLFGQESGKVKCRIWRPFWVLSIWGMIRNGTAWPTQYFGEQKIENAHRSSKHHQLSVSYENYVKQSDRPLILYKYLTANHH